MTKARDLADGASALSAVSATELGYIDGVTSAIQTQLDAKAPSSTAVTLTGTQTLTNKTLTNPVIASVVNNTLTTAKGDLISATAASTPARLAVGNDGEQIVADSSTSTGLRYNAAAKQNLLANGAFDIWQRGVGTFSTTQTYTTDRWFIYSANNGSVTQETSVIPDGATYAVKMATSGGSSYVNLQQTLEQSDVEKLAGKTVTFSVYLRANATYNGTFSLQLNWSTTGNSQTPTWTNLASTNHTPSTSAYTRVSVTGTVPTTAKGLTFMIAQNAVLASGSIYYAALAKAELGSVATPFVRMGGTYQADLAACQRYYFRANWDAQAAYPVFGIGGGYSTTQARFQLPLPVNMRRQGTALDVTTLSNLRVQSFNDGTSIVPTALSADSNFTTTTTLALNATVASGLTANVLYYLRGEGSTAYYIGWSAEL